MPTRRLLPVLALLAALAVGCGDDDDDGGSGTSGPSGEPAAGRQGEPARAGQRRGGATIKLGDSQYGKVLFDGSGQAIYLFDKEKSKRPRCYGACAAAWPPVLTRGRPRAAAGAKASLLGTTKRRDGKKQVTYDGHPLYFYAHEDKNEVLCHNVPGFGGLWLALDGDGEPPPA